MIDSKRLDWIDALRALAIILVVFGHCSKDSHFFFLFTSPVKMPLFFAISAFLFKDVSSTFLYLKGVFLKLVVPWFFLGLFPTILSIPVKGLGYCFDYFLAMLKGDVIWFMPCFIIAQIIQFLLRKIFKKTCALALAMLLCSAFGLLLAHAKLGHLAMFNNALVVQAFYLIGFLFKNQSPFFARIKTIHVVVGCLVYVLLCVLSEILFPGMHIDVHLNYYYNFLLCFVLIYLGTFLLFIIASKLKNFSFISKIGQNTLVIYIWHGYAVALLVVILKKLGVDDHLYGLALVKTLFACIACCLVSIVMNRYVPFLIGKKSRK